MVAASPPELDDDERPPRSGWSAGRLLIALAVVGMAAMWGYVLYLAFGPGRADPIDRLDDPAFAVDAESRCAAAVDEIDALPHPQETKTSAARG